MLKENYMKKLILSMALLLPIHTAFADDSVYAWGSWSQGIQPAAGGIASATPTSAQTPNVKFRPNEHPALNRGTARAIDTANANNNIPQSSPPNMPAAPAIPAAPVF